jgi:hypothetical protein
MLIGAILTQDGTRLLYAAQVALAAAHSPATQPKTDVVNPSPALAVSEILPVYSVGHPPGLYLPQVPHPPPPVKL